MLKKHSNQILLGEIGIVLYNVSIHLYSASCSAHQSEARPGRETQREESRGSKNLLKERLHGRNLIYFIFTVVFLQRRYILVGF